MVGNGREVWGKAAGVSSRRKQALINEAARLVDEGVAAPAEIDQAMRLGALHPAGPLQVADLIGLDVCLRILETLSRSLDNPFYRPARALVERVEAGRLGRKTGQGFYTY